MELDSVIYNDLIEMLSDVSLALKGDKDSNIKIYDNIGVDAVTFLGMVVEAFDLLRDGEKASWYENLEHYI